MTRLVQAARKYIGTKFVHQGRKSHGLDCVGLVWIAYKDCGIALDPYRAYPREPNSEELAKRATDCLGEPVMKSPVMLKNLLPGDVVMLYLPKEKNPHHVGIVGDYAYGSVSLIHAHGSMGKKGCVVEHRLPEDMAKRITHVFRRPV